MNQILVIAKEIKTKEAQTKKGVQEVAEKPTEPQVQKPIVTQKTVSETTEVKKPAEPKPKDEFISKLNDTKESVKAKLKVAVKRILRKYGYPPDMQMLATETVLKQAEMIANEITT